jgi:hypothetical protein
MCSQQAAPPKSLSSFNNSMTDADLLRSTYVSLEVNADFTETLLALRDDSRLCFRHRVGERTATATSDTALAGQVLAKIARFRLNARHLDVQFEDGSRWETLFGG